MTPKDSTKGFDRNNINFHHVDSETVHDMYESNDYSYQPMGHIANSRKNS